MCCLMYRGVCLYLESMLDGVTWSSCAIHGIMSNSIFQTKNQKKKRRKKRRHLEKLRQREQQKEQPLQERSASTSDPPVEIE